MSNLNPIVFSSVMNTRFSDFDLYGHMNASKYLDFVVSSRWEYQTREQGVTPEDFIQNGLGFFLSKFQIDYLVPISPKQSGALVKSWVTKMEGAKLFITFTVSSEDTALLHAKGDFVCIAMDLQRSRPCAVPGWVHPYIFQLSP